MLCSGLSHHDQNPTLERALSVDEVHRDRRPGVDDDARLTHGLEGRRRVEQSIDSGDGLRIELHADRDGEIPVDALVAFVRRLRGTIKHAMRIRE